MDVIGNAREMINEKDRIKEENERKAEEERLQNERIKEVLDDEFEEIQPPRKII